MMKFQWFTYAVALLTASFLIASLSGCMSDDNEKFNDCDNTGHDGQCWVLGIGNVK